MKIKTYLRRNAITLILLVGMIALYFCIPSQIAENMVAKAAISPRFFPLVSIAGIIVCCVLLLIFDAKEYIFAPKQAQEKAKSEQEVSYLRVLLVALLLLAWYFFMPHIGFILSTIVVMCVMSFLLGCRSKIVLLVFPVVFTLLVYFVFSELLHVNLPEILF